MLILEYSIEEVTKIETFDSQSNLFLYVKSRGIRKEDILSVIVVKKVGTLKEFTPNVLCPMCEEVLDFSDNKGVRSIFKEGENEIFDIGVCPACNQWYNLVLNLQGNEITCKMKKVDILFEKRGNNVEL